MKKILSIATIAFVFGLSACNHDDEEKSSSDLSKTDAKAKISSFNTTATQDLQDLSSSKGLKAITDLSNLTTIDDPFGGRAATDKKKVKEFLRKKGQTFRTILNNKYNPSGRTNEDGFNFDTNTGVYEWNEELQEFEKTGESDIIKVLFPSEGSNTNNAELRLNAYTETQLYDEEAGENFYEPTSIDAELFVDGSKAASLQADVTWDPSDIPLTADITVSVVPFTASVSFDVTANNKNSLTASLTRDSHTIFATSIDVLYSSSNKSDENVETVSGFVQLIDLKVQGNVDVKGIDAVQGDFVDYDKFVDLTVTAENKKVGKVIFQTETENGDQVSIAYIQYADGTKEKLEDLIQPVLDELDSIEEDING